MRPIFPIVLTLAVYATSTTAQELQPRWRPTKSLARALDLQPGVQPAELVLKLVDDAGGQAAGGRLSSTRLDLAPVEAVLAAFPEVRVTPLVEVDRAALAHLRALGEERSREELADLSQLFRLSLAETTDVSSLVAALHALELVENAYVAPSPAPSPGDLPNPVTPDFTPQQGYRTAAPSGIDAVHASGVTGGDGSGVTIVDLEYRWNIAHEDLMGLGAGVHIGPAPAQPAGWTATQWAAELEHGTAVLGVLAADADAFGVTGLATGATIRTVAANTATGYDVPGALVRATLALASGDMILIEQQAFGPNGGSFFVPVEFNDAEFFAIRQATALGIHVIEAAGNGFQNLDDDGSGGGTAGDPSYPTVFDVRFRDSGAVMVGAATTGSSHWHLGFSNYGERVDSYAIGEWVWSLGYGPNSPSWLGCTDAFPAGAADANQWYAQCFSGTSSASPMVASAIAALEASHLSLWGETLHPRAARGLVRTTGTRSSDWNTRPIGRMPDLADQLSIVAMGPQPAVAVNGVFANVEGGRAVAALGDIDGDGFDDLVAGMPGFPGFAPKYGGVEVVSGATGERVPCACTASPSTDESFGHAVVDAGDQNADGLDDMAVGSPLADSNGVDAGWVYVYQGDPQQVNQLVRHTGEASGDRFGYAVAKLDDGNGDGSDELLVGAPYHDATGTDAGKVYRYVGGVLAGQSFGAGAQARFGFSVCGLGDIDNDNVPDYAVGSPEDVVTQRGRVLLFSGANDAQLFSFGGPAIGDEQGYDVAPAGDLDGDGRGDVLTGIPGNDTGGNDAGAVRVYSTISGSLLLTINGTVAGERFGTSVAGGGDWDGDGQEDFLIGAPGVGNGAAYVYDRNGTLLGTYTGHSASSAAGFGASVDWAGDRDGDGRDDVLIGTPGDDGESSNAGRAYLFYAPAPAGQGGPVAPSLVADLPSISAAWGGEVWTGNAATMSLRAGTAHAGKTYLILASLAGSTPGIPLPTGLTLPINIDTFTTTVLSLSGGPPFAGFIGITDGSGDANASVGPFVPGSLTPLVGIQIFLAAATLDYAFVSNPTTMTIQP